MTRLIAEQVLGIPGNLGAFDRELIKKTGSSLKELALAAAGPGFAPGPAPPDPAACRVAVIPVTAGQGTIKGFSEALCAIAAHLGFRAFITGATDVAGLAEAYCSNAGIALMADDHFYAAINLINRRVADNEEATARGYTIALKKMAGSLDGREVLLIGAGPLGAEAAKALLCEGARLIIYDLVKEKETALAGCFGGEERKRITAGLDLQQALARTNLIFDASPGDGFIPAALLNPDTFIAAPGLPLGLDAAAAQKFAGRLIHEPLQIGTAVMLFKALL